MLPAGLSFVPALALLTLQLVAKTWGEAPPGAAPSQGTTHFFADYELRLSPEQLGAPHLQWRLPAWRFQHDLQAFYAWRGPCAGTGLPCPAPPLGVALFVLSLPESEQQRILQECPGLLLASIFLIAEARLHTDRGAALAMFRQAERLRGEVPAPGWGLDVASQWFASAYDTLPPGDAPAWECDSGAAAVDVVVAHCDEDLEWLSQFKGARIWLYEKCGAAAGPILPCVTRVALPNLAMESLAYATHLRDQYGRFAPFTVFLQGSPEEHAPRQLLDDLTGSLRAGTFAAPFAHLNARRFLGSASVCLEDMHRRLFPEVAEVPAVFGSYCCSQFVVRRDRLLARSKEFYERVNQYLLGQLPVLCSQDVAYDPRPRIAISALFEHLWHIVFGEAPVLPPRHTDGRLPLFLRADAMPGELPDAYAVGHG